MTEQQDSSSPLVLVIGSGPIGAVFAREVLGRASNARVLMVEMGPQLTDVPGMSVRNITDPQEKEAARRRSQGPMADADSPLGLGIPSGTVVEGTYTARQGTYLFDFGQAGAAHAKEFPAAAASTCVGGMGAHWTGATPRPEFSERIPFIDAAEWDELVLSAEALLHTDHDAFRGSAIAEAIVASLRDHFGSELPEGFQPGFMPVAADRQPDGTVRWVGADDVFGPVIQPGTDESARFELRAETIARRVLLDGDRAVGAVLEDRRAGTRTEVLADVVVVAADAIRGPQLLWASGVRPRALGHYLTTGLGIFSVVALDGDRIGDYIDLPAIEAERARRDAAVAAGADPVVAAIRIPFSEPASPYSSQIMYLDRSPVPLPEGHPLANNPWGYANVGSGTRTYDRFENRVEFDDSELDWNGFPNMTFHYGHTTEEESELDAAERRGRQVAATLGDYIPGGEPRIMPDGSSLHYKGTTRIGAADDGESVCDAWSRVWGYRNLYVGGNGTIPTPSTANPTLTSVAIAVRAARTLAELLS